MTKMVLLEEIKFRISVIVGGNWEAPKARGRFHSIRTIFNIGEVGVRFSSRYHQFIIMASQAV